MSNLRHDKKFNVGGFGACLAKYALDTMRKNKGDISKAVAAKKKADKKADISAETAQSKALDD